MMTTQDGPGAGPDSSPPPGAPAGGSGGPRVGGAEMRDLKRLRRTRGDRYVAGVAGGLARHLDVDPVVPRVALAVLVLFGGSGLLLYGALWLLVPVDDTDEAVVHLDDRTRNVALLIAAALAGFALLGDLVSGWVPWPLLFLGLVVALVVGQHQRRSEERARNWASYAMPNVPTTPPPADAGPAAAAPGSPYGPTSPYAAPPAVPLTKAHDAPVPPVQPVPPVPPVRRPHKPGPILFWTTLALVSLGVGLLAVVDLAGADVVASAYPALALAVVGAVLVVGSFFGRPGGLILLGLALVPAVALALVVENVAGARLDVRPTQASTLDERYVLGAGETVVDLGDVQDVAGLEGRRLTVEGGVGRIEVVLPEGLDAAVHTDVGFGSVRLLDRSGEGPGLSLNQAYDAPGTTPGVDEPTALTVDVRLGVGEVVVVTR